MNMISENDRELAKTLNSLSFDEPEDSYDMPAHRPRRWRWAMVLMVLLIGFGAALLYWPELPERLGVEAQVTQIKTKFPVLDITAETEPQSVTPVDAASQPATDQMAAASTTTVGYVPPPVMNEITGSGHVTALKTSNIFSSLEGVVASVSVELLDEVTAGQELLRLEGSRQQFALQSAKIAESRAQLALKASAISLEDVKSQLARDIKLRERGTIPAKQLLDSKMAVQRAENQFAQVQQDLEQSGLAVHIAQYDVDQLIVRAPFAGTITALNVLVGDQVSGQDGPQLADQSLMTIIDTQDITIEADVAERNVAALSPGVTGEAVLDAFPDQPFEIVLDSIAPVVSAQKGTINLRFRPLNPPSGTRPNMAARVRITPEQ